MDQLLMIFNPYLPEKNFNKLKYLKLKVIKKSCILENSYKYEV